MNSLIVLTAILIAQAEPPQVPEPLQHVLADRSEAKWCVLWDRTEKGWGVGVYAGKDCGKCFLSREDAQAEAGRRNKKSRVGDDVRECNCSSACECTEVWPDCRCNESCRSRGPGDASVGVMRGGPTYCQAALFRPTAPARQAPASLPHHVWQPLPAPSINRPGRLPLPPVRYGLVPTRQLMRPEPSRMSMPVGRSC